MYQPQYISPYNMGINQCFNQNQNQQIVRVNGIEGAKAYQMTPNSMVALFDNNNDIFYVKSTDGAGFATIRSFKFNEIAGNETGTSADLDKRLSDLKKEVEEIKGVINGKFNIQQEQ